jgi:hypothetical protein
MASDRGENCKQLLYNHTEIFHQLDCVLLSEFSLIENQSDKIYPADHVVDQFVN